MIPTAFPIIILSMKTLDILVSGILRGEPISHSAACELLDVPFPELCHAADTIRRESIGSRANLCTILNAKSGRCSENCRYCAQSIHYKTETEDYPMVLPEKALKTARRNEASGVQRFSLVTSGRTLSDEEFDNVVAIYALLRKETSLTLCASLGFLTPERAARLIASGVSHYHHNLEACRAFFPQTCTTHTWEERAETIRGARKAGMSICSGGIFGLGETIEHRVQLAFELRDLQVDSVPLNVLMPIAGTPLEHQPLLKPDEILRSMAIFRFVLPKADIRLAGGRLTLGSQIETALTGGINAALTGDFLTTTGSSTMSDITLFKKLGFELC